MSDCFVLYLLLTCMKKKTSGADKFTNNTKASLISEAVNVLSNMSELQIQQCLAMMRALKNVQITD